MRIPFNKPCFVGNEQKYIRQAIAEGKISGDGVFTHRCHDSLESSLGVQNVLLTTSCTHALEMAALLLDLQPGEEVIVPSFTFVSTVNAFVLHGAKPVFADIRPDTLNIDESRIERLVTPRTRAVIVVHYAGVGCEMDAILRMAGKHRFAVVEDNAHGLFGKYKGRFLGTFGCLAALSFHETKNFSCGEGGALLINDPRYNQRAEIIREKGTNRSQVFRGEADKYSWVDVGSSYLPSDLLAAFLLAQLEARDKIQKKRRQIWEYYSSHLHKWAQDNGVRLPVIPPHCEHSCHMFYLIMPSMQARQALIAHLKSRDILGVFHYLPLHSSTMGKRFGGSEDDCPVTRNISETLVRLPFFYSLTEEEQADVVEAVVGFGA